LIISYWVIFTQILKKFKTYIKTKDASTFFLNFEYTKLDVNFFIKFYGFIELK